MPFAVVCPNGHKLKAPEHLANKQLRCPKCQAAVGVPRRPAQGGAVGQPAPQAGVGNKGTSIRVSCPHCGKSLRLASARVVGQEKQCPSCRQAFVVQHPVGPRSAGPSEGLPPDPSPFDPGGAGFPTAGVLPLDPTGVLPLEEISIDPLGVQSGALAPTTSWNMATQPLPPLPSSPAARGRKAPRGRASRAESLRWVWVSSIAVAALIAFVVGGVALWGMVGKIGQPIAAQPGDAGDRQPGLYVQTPDGLEKVSLETLAQDTVARERVARETRETVAREIVARGGGPSKALPSGVAAGSGAKRSRSAIKRPLKDIFGNEISESRRNERTQSRGQQPADLAEQTRAEAEARVALKLKDPANWQMPPDWWHPLVQLQPSSKKPFGVLISDAQSEDPNVAEAAIAELAAFPDRKEKSLPVLVDLLKAGTRNGSALVTTIVHLRPTADELMPLLAPIFSERSAIERQIERQIERERRKDPQQVSAFADGSSQDRERAFERWQELDASFARDQRELALQDWARQCLAGMGPDAASHLSVVLDDGLFPRAETYVVKAIGAPVVKDLLTRFQNADTLHRKIRCVELMGLLGPRAQEALPEIVKAIGPAAKSLQRPDRKTPTDNLLVQLLVASSLIEPGHSPTRKAMDQVIRGNLLTAADHWLLVDPRVLDSMPRSAESVLLVVQMLAAWDPTGQVLEDSAYHRHWLQFVRYLDPKAVALLRPLADSPEGTANPSRIVARHVLYRVGDAPELADWNDNKVVNRAKAAVKTAGDDRLKRQLSWRLVAQAGPRAESVIPTLMEHCKDLAGWLAPEPGFPRDPLVALGNIGHAAVDELVELLQSDVEVRIKQRILEELGNMGHEAQEALPTIAKFFEGELGGHAQEAFVDICRAVCLDPFAEMPPLQTNRRPLSRRWTPAEVQAALDNKMRLFITRECFVQYMNANRARVEYRLSPTDQAILGLLKGGPPEQGGGEGWVYACLFVAGDDSVAKELRRRLEFSIEIFTHLSTLSDKAPPATRARVRELCRDHVPSDKAEISRAGERLLLEIAPDRKKEDPRDAPNRVHPLWAIETLEALAANDWGLSKANENPSEIDTALGLWERTRDERALGYLIYRAEIAEKQVGYDTQILLELESMSRLGVSCDRYWDRHMALDGVPAAQALWQLRPTPETAAKIVAALQLDRPISAVSRKHFLEYPKQLGDLLLEMGPLAEPVMPLLQVVVQTCPLARGRSEAHRILRILEGKSFYLR